MNVKRKESFNMTPEEFRYRDDRKAPATPVADAATPETPNPSGVATPFCEKIMKGDTDHASAEKWIVTGQGSVGAQS